MDIKKDAIIVDIDGTLALKGPRSIFDFKKVEVDFPNLPIILIVKAMVEKYPEMKILITSGREDICREETIRWLHKYNIYFDELFMRKAKDGRADYLVKEEIYINEIEPNYDIMFILDDRDQVVNMWRERGLVCLQVAKGNF